MAKRGRSGPAERDDVGPTKPEYRAARTEDADDSHAGASATTSSDEALAASEPMSVETMSRLPTAGEPPRGRQRSGDPPAV